MADTAPRVITLGDSGVGKTALIHRMKTGEFLADTSPTIGAGVTAVDVEVRGTRYPLQLWDTAGQELYRNIIPIYFKGAVFAMICFSVGDHRSFESLDSWLREIEQHSSSEIGLVLVGTKYDVAERVVTEDAAKRYADDHKLPVVFTSSVSGQGVTELLEHVAVTQALGRKARETVPVGAALTDGLDKKKPSCW
jgi:small GTP-binding protein